MNMMLPNLCTRAKGTVSLKRTMYCVKNTFDTLHILTNCLLQMENVISRLQDAQNELGVTEKSFLNFVYVVLWLRIRSATDFRKLLRIYSIWERSQQTFVLA